MRIWQISECDASEVDTEIANDRVDGSRVLCSADDSNDSLPTQYQAETVRSHTTTGNLSTEFILRMRTKRHVERRNIVRVGSSYVDKTARDSCQSINRSRNVGAGQGTPS